MNEPKIPKIRPDSFEAMTSDEKAAAMRAQLYATLKERGALGVYYQLYPDERPVPRSRVNDGERER